MKLAVFSDLHLDNNRSDQDFAPYVADDVDVVVVAGDIAAPVSASMRWAHEHYAGRPVILVAGNHEHYGQVLEMSLKTGADARAIYPNVHLLENAEVIVGGVRFLGTTLWTDFDLYGDPSSAMSAARRMMNDYHVIGSLTSDGRQERLTPQQTLEMHVESRAWLETALAVPFDGPTVVVTHAGPHPLSVAPQFRDNVLTPSFVSDLSEIIEAYQPDLWIHGHTHASFDYTVPSTRTRVVCNPRGYLRSGSGPTRAVPENDAFDPDLVVEV